MTQTPAFPSPDFHQGRRVLITGAASGIGAAAVEKFSALGAQVLAVDLNEEGLAALAERVPNVVPTPCDLSDLDSIATKLPTDVDVVVNNAGIQLVCPIQDFPLETFEKILRIMLHAPFYIVRQSLPHMYARGWGRIVNVSSAHGLRASPFKSAYVTAKHGLEGLNKVIALEGGPHGVTSTTINPAYVRTPLVEKQITDQAKTHGIPEQEVVEKIMLSGVAVKRLIEPEEVADLIAFVTGPASACMTGSSYTMDAGWTAR